MKNKIEEWCLLWILPIAIVILWFVASYNHLTNESVLPAPWKVGTTLVNMIKSGELWKNISVSLIRVLKGYAIGAVLGLVIGTLAGLFIKFNWFIDIVINVLRPIPAIALIPFFILWMGIGEESKVLVITFGSFWPILLNTIQGIHAADKKLLEVGRILEKNHFVILFQIIIPAALPSIFTGLRLGVSTAWTCVVAAEMIAASSGVGFLIMYSRDMAQPASLLIGILIIGFMGLLLDLLLKKLNHKLIYWDERL